MGNTFTSWSGLVLALQQEVAEATAEVIDASMDDLFMNTDQFYSSSEGRYTRTGTLRQSITLTKSIQITISQMQK